MEEVPPRSPPVVIEVVIQLKKWGCGDGRQGGAQIRWHAGAVLDGSQVKGVPHCELADATRIWRPSVFANAGFSLGAAEKYEQLPTFKYLAMTEKSSDGTLCMD